MVGGQKSGIRTMMTRGGKHTHTHTHAASPLPSLNLLHLLENESVWNLLMSAERLTGRLDVLPPRACQPAWQPVAARDGGASPQRPRTGTELPEQRCGCWLSSLTTINNRVPSAAPACTFPPLRVVGAVPFFPFTPRPKRSGERQRAANVRNNKGRRKARLSLCLRARTQTFPSDDVRGPPGAVFSASGPRMQRPLSLAVTSCALLAGHARASVRASRVLGHTPAPCAASREEAVLPPRPPPSLTCAHT